MTHEVMTGSPWECRMVNPKDKPKPNPNLSLSLSRTQNQWKTYSTGVDVTVDGDRLDAHLATGLDHLIQREKNKAHEW